MFLLVGVKRLMSVSGDNVAEQDSFNRVVLEALRQSGALGILRSQIRGAVLNVVHAEDPEAMELTAATKAATGDEFAREALSLCLDLFKTYKMISADTLAQEIPQRIISTSRTDTARALGITPQEDVPLLVTLLRSSRERVPYTSVAQQPLGLDEETGSVTYSDHTATGDHQSELLGMDDVVECEVKKLPQAAAKTHAVPRAAQAKASSESSATTTTNNVAALPLDMPFPNLSALTHRELDILLTMHNTTSATPHEKKELKASTLKENVYQGDSMMCLRDLAQHNLLHILRCEDLDAVCVKLLAERSSGPAKELPKVKLEKSQLVKELLGI